MDFGMSGKSPDGQSLALNQFENISFNQLYDNLYDYSYVLFKQVIWLIKHVM